MIFCSFLVAVGHLDRRIAQVGNLAKTQVSQEVQGELFCFGIVGQGQSWSRALLFRRLARISVLPISILCRSFAPVPSRRGSILLPCEQIGHRPSHGFHHIGGSAASVAEQQNPPIIAFRDMQALLSVIVRRAQRQPSGPASL